MNKLFRRHQQEPVEKRSNAFIKRLEESKRLDPQQRQSEIEALAATTTPPKIQVDDLSATEWSTYQTWWKDVDPFHIGKADNEAVFKFVSGCGLPDHKLEEILALFQDQKEGLTKEQFFAILRLIAHAQNGRMINRDIVYLGAPLPRFQTQAIRNDILADPTLNNDMMRMPSWMNPTKKVTGAQSTILPNATLNTPKSYTPTPHISHARSRSVPYDFLSKIDNDGSFDLLGKPEPRRSTNHSMDADHNSQKMMDTGRSLLLTQSFQPNFNNDDQPTTTTAASSNSGKMNSYNPYLTTNTNPFETDDSTATTPTFSQTPTISHNQPLNTCVNSRYIPPPPVPPQSTKPAYPKYARTRLF